MTFDPAVALAYARRLAQPRLVGTPGEVAAIDFAAAHLAGSGWSVNRQPFAFSAGAQVATALELGLAQSLILLTFAAWSHSAWVGALPAGLLLVLLALTGALHRAMASGSLEPPSAGPPTPWQGFCRRIGPRRATVNLVAARPAPRPAVAAPAPPRLYLVAHSDSKSQALPLVARMLLIALAVGAALAFGTMALLRPLLPGLTSAAAVTGVLALLAGMPLLLLFLAGPGNRSPGAIDNASGLGLVLHLAEVLSQSEPAVAITCLITGAEELGVVGATAFVAAAPPADRLPDSAVGVHVLNFDGIGGRGRLALVAPGRAGSLARLVQACCVELSLPLGRLPVVGALFDHIPFVEAGYDAVTLVTIGPAARAVHTPGDDVDQLDVEGFRQAGEVALRVVQKLADGAGGETAATAADEAGP